MLPQNHVKPGEGPVGSCLSEEGLVRGPLFSLESACSWERRCSLFPQPWGRSLGDLTWHRKAVTLQVVTASISSGSVFYCKLKIRSLLKLTVFPHSSCSTSSQTRL